MRIWIDDVREAPDDWLWCTTSEEAITLLDIMRYRGMEIDEIAFDHDLGTTPDGDLDDTRRVVIWIIENEYFPRAVRLLTANPVGYEWLQGMVNRYFPDETVVPW